MLEAEITETPQPSELKPTNWPKIILAAFLGLALLAGAAYAGYWYGIESSKFKSLSAPGGSKPQPKTQNLTPVPPVVTPTPTPNPTANWETYNNQKYGFSITVPAQMIFYGEEPAGELSWASKPRNETFGPNYPYGNVFEANKILHSLGCYTIYVWIAENKPLQPRYGFEMPLNIENLKKMFEEPIEEVNFRGRKAIKAEQNWSQGEVGGSIDYYIIDNKKLIHLMGTTYNLDIAPISYIDQILSTFKFLD